MNMNRDGNTANSLLLFLGRPQRLTVSINTNGTPVYLWI